MLICIDNSIKYTKTYARTTRTISPGTRPGSLTAQLTASAEGLFAENAGLVQHVTLTGSPQPVERLTLAVPSEGVDQYSQKPTHRLTPVILDRSRAGDGSTHYEQHSGVPHLSEMRTTWSGKPGAEAHIRYRARNGGWKLSTDPTPLDRLQDNLNSLQTGIPYNPDKQIIILGLRQDRLLNRGPVGRVVRLAMSARKVIGGDLDPMTHV